jgi:hypothetical protein
MSRYHPIDCGVRLQASRSDLASIEWSTNSLTLGFFLPDNEAHFLRVSFDRLCIIRVLDEMALSTEETETPE